MSLRLKSSTEQSWDYMTVFTCITPPIQGMENDISCQGKTNRNGQSLIY
uniref:Uncharacterized protein n=1 Tax=Rhizophora mucronata TaxID=61149 RepID=A0A2P2PS84_RHIMU